MAELTINLRTNPESGKKDIIISLKGDSDAMPHEHEQHHRSLVNKLIEGGLVKAEELGKVVVERSEEEAVNIESENKVAERQTQAQGH